MWGESSRAFRVPATVLCPPSEGEVPFRPASFLHSPNSCPFTHCSALAASILLSFSQLMGLQTTAGRPNSAHHLGLGARNGSLHHKRTKDYWPLRRTVVGRLEFVYWLQNLNCLLSCSSQDTFVDSCMRLWLF